MADQQAKLPKTLRTLPLTRLLPNMLTLMSLCSGLTAMRFGLMEKWHEAIIGIVFAMLFDILDGRVARLLNTTSKFGAELDSLSDAISFGVAPGFIMYQWSLSANHDFGWIAVLAFAVCSALRLARFNTMLEDEVAPAWTKRFFTGIPAPAGAGLVLVPLTAFLQFGDEIVLPSTLLCVWLIIVGGLMVSRMPTLAIKGWRVAPGWVAPIFVLAVLFFAALVTNPWLTLTGLGLFYMALLPVGLVAYYHRKSQEEKEASNA